MTADDLNNRPGSVPLKGISYIPEDPKARPLVSVLTPVRNPGKGFHETALSLLHQSLQRFEWIIIDDATDDPESLAIVSHYATSDSRVILERHETRKGLPAARNTGLKHAGCGYLFQLDDGDLIEPTALEKYLWFLVSHPDCFFVKGWTILFGGNAAKDRLNGFDDPWAFFQENRAANAVMMRASVPRRVGGYDESKPDHFSTWEFWLNCAGKGLWGGTVWEYLDWHPAAPDLKEKEALTRQQEDERFKKMLPAKHAVLFQNGFPEFDRLSEEPYGTLDESCPFRNDLKRNSAPRLLMMIPWFAVGGADMVNLDLLTYLATAHGYEITVCATLNDEKEWFPRFKQYTDDIFILPDFLHKKDYPRFVDYLISSRGFDALLLSNSLYGYQTMPYIRSRHEGLAIINFEHIEEPGWRQGNYPRFAANLQSCFDFNVVSTGHLKEWMMNNGADGDKIKVCYTNIDTEKWQPDPQVRHKVRTRLSIPENEPVILFSGRFVPQKRPDLLASILLKLKEKKLAFRCLAAGDGPLRAELEAFISDNCLEPYLDILGFVTPEELFELFCASDILLLPSINEGIALSCYEAMSMGIPVVCSDVGGQSELVISGCGHVVPVDQEEEELYVRCLAELIEDPGLRKKMGAASRHRVTSRFRIEKMPETIHGILSEAIAIRRKKSESGHDPGVARSYCIEMLELNRLRAGTMTAPGIDGGRQDIPPGVLVQEVMASRTFRLTTALIALIRREAVKANFLEIVRLLLPERVKRFRREMMAFSIKKRIKRLTAVPVPIQKSVGVKKITLVYIANWVIVGGADKMTIDWFKSLDKEKFETYLITTEESDNAWIDKIRGEADGIFDLPLLGFDTHLSKERFILDFIAKKCVDIVHVMNSDTGFRALQAIKQQFAGIKVAAQFHCFDYLDNGRRIGYANDIPKKMGRYIDVFMVDSKILKQDLEADLPESEKGRVRLIYAGVDTAEFDKNTTGRESGRDGLSILYIARLDRQKQPLIMAAVAKELHKRCVLFQIDVIGDGSLDSQKPDLENFIRQEGLEERVILHGNRPPEEMGQWYAGADVLLLTSKWEGIPLVLFQAMSCGVICVAPDVGGINELLNSENGFLLSDYRDVTAYADILEKIASDKQGFDRIRDSARASIRNRFDMERMGRDYGRLYYDLAGGPDLPLPDESGAG